MWLHTKSNILQYSSDPSYYVNIFTLFFWNYRIIFIWLLAQRIELSQIKIILSGVNASLTGPHWLALSPTPLPKNPMYSHWAPLNSVDHHWTSLIHNESSWTPSDP